MLLMYLGMMHFISFGVIFGSTTSKYGLVEKGLEDDDFIAWLNKGHKRAQHAYKSSN
jgi:hypothetical protein